MTSWPPTPKPVLAADGHPIRPGKSDQQTYAAFFDDLKQKIAAARHREGLSSALIKVWMSSGISGSCATKVIHISIDVSPRLPDRVWCSTWLHFSRVGMQMFRTLANLLERRRNIRRRYQADARMLIQDNEHGAYYGAQRLAARSRTAGNIAEFWHWAKIASEVARLSPNAEMDIRVVEAINDEERSKGRR